MRKNALALLLLYPTLFMGQSNRLTIDDLLSPGPSAGGSANGRTVEDEATSDSKYTITQEHGQIALKPMDGSPEKVLTSSEDSKSELSLSPDRKNIAYVSQGQIWIVALSGAEPLQLTHDLTGPGDPRGATDHHPQWNPKGGWILYESGQKGYNELYVVSTDGRTSNELAATEIFRGKDVIANPQHDQGDAVSSDRFDPRPLWSPDGTRLSYTERSREFFSGKLKVLPFDQKTGTAAGPVLDIYTAKNDPGGAWAINTAAWSPNGATLAVVLQETHWDKIWLIPSSGGSQRS